MSQSDLERFKDLSYEDFKILATDKSLSPFQKIGFPNAYRAGLEGFIFDDIIQKLWISSDSNGKILLDIGAGCSELPLTIIDQCRQYNMTVLLNDSREMLDYLPDDPHVKKFFGEFPKSVGSLLKDYKGKVDYIISYSVFQYVFTGGHIFDFLDAAIELLKPGGRFLLGDIPNVSKRSRFFKSDAGIAFHQKFTGTEDLPDEELVNPDKMGLDDKFLFEIIAIYRRNGLDVYWLPQDSRLPMQNRREDLLFCKP